MEIEETVEDQCQFENVIAKGNVYLKFVGLKLDIKDGYRKFTGRLRFRRYYIFTLVCLSLDFVGQLLWLIGNVLNGNSDLVEITFVIPCLTVTLMASVKSFYFIKYVHNIHNIIATLKKLKRERLRNVTKKEDEFEKRTVTFLNTANRVITWASILGITTFGIGPLLISATIFYNTGDIKLFFPFIFYYPFNEYDIRIWPFLYVQQIWSAIVSTCTIWGPDYISYAVTKFIIIQFFSLNQDIKYLIPKSGGRQIFVTNDIYREKLRSIVNCHNDLMRCVELMEATYSKTILFNVVASSILICFNIFNVTTNNNIVLMAPFTAFFVMVLGQIFLLCYFGDLIMRSSTEVNDAVYKSRWYGADAAITRDLIIISLRANKPCKLTAYGYSDVNLITFTKILSTSWSYFALLQTLYKKNNIA